MQSVRATLRCGAGMRVLRCVALGDAWRAALFVVLVAVPWGVASALEGYARASVELAARVIAPGRHVVLRHASVPMRELRAGPREVVIVVDETLTDVWLDLAHPGATRDVSFALLDPEGIDTKVDVHCQGQRAAVPTVACLGRYGPGVAAGVHRLRIGAARGAPSTGEVALRVLAVPRRGLTYHVTVSVWGGRKVITYPEPMIVRANVTHETPLAGVAVEAEVRALDGTGRVEPLPLRDDGLDGDAIEDDGTYSGTFHYRRDGDYEVRVWAHSLEGGVRSTTRGMVSSFPLEVLAPVVIAVSSPPCIWADSDCGPVPDPWVLHPVDALFSRVDSARVRVVGVRDDDHADGVSGGCTPVAADNRDVWARVDSAGDVDCFAFVAPGGEDVFVRATALLGGADPLVEVRTRDGGRVVARGSLGASANPFSGVIVRVPAGLVDPAGLTATVEDRDRAAVGGGYAFSAGAEIISDSPAW